MILCVSLSIKDMIKKTRTGIGHMFYANTLKPCTLKSCTLEWRHNVHDGVSNQQPHDCLLNRLFRRRSTSKLRVTGLCVGNSPVTSEFPAQRSSNAENVSIWWRHHDSKTPTGYCFCLELSSVEFFVNNTHSIALEGQSLRTILTSHDMAFSSISLS